MSDTNEKGVCVTCGARIVFERDVEYETGVVDERDGYRERQIGRVFQCVNGHEADEVEPGTPAPPPSATFSARLTEVRPGKPMPFPDDPPSADGEAGKVLDHECTTACDHPAWWYAKREIAALREQVGRLDDEREAECHAKWTEKARADKAEAEVERLKAWPIYEKLTTAEFRIAFLEGLIREAPHAPDCPDCGCCPSDPCTCFKARAALDAPGGEATIRPEEKP